MELSGKVAVLTDALDAVVSIRDLGPNPVPVKANVLAFAEDFPSLSDGEQYTNYSDEIGLETVTRTWSKSAIPAPDRVTARQFKMQLHIAGLLQTVEAWVAGQEELVQIAYANSGTFVKSEPMMQAGFAALGFTSGQIDEFFTLAEAI